MEILRYQAPIKVDVAAASMAPMALRLSAGWFPASLSARSALHISAPFSFARRAKYRKGSHGKGLTSPQDHPQRVRTLGKFLKLVS
jgi:hypothetical protein